MDCWALVVDGAGCVMEGATGAGEMTMAVGEATDAEGMDELLGGAERAAASGGSGVD